jgi:hypothetical protein
MRIGSFLAPAALVSASVWALAGCNMDQRYVAPIGMACPDPMGCVTWQLAMTPATPPLIEGEEASLFVIETRVELPVRAPTDDQFAALSEPTVPYPRHPWVTRGDYEMEMEYTISNLSTDGIRVAITLNGFNEFHEYVPTARIVDDELQVDYAGYERVYDLGPGERITATVREEEIDEIAVDLATVVNGAPNSNQIVYFENQSSLDPRSQPFIPMVVPALTGMRMGLRVETGAGGTAPPVALEASLHVRDPSDRIVGEGDVDHMWVLPVPAPFMPVAPMVP